MLVTSDEPSILGVNSLWDLGSVEDPCTALINDLGARARERLPVEPSAMFEKGENTVKPNHTNDELQRRQAFQEVRTAQNAVASVHIRVINRTVRNLK